MNKVIYGAYTFEDAALNLLAGGKATTYYSPLGDELRAAYFSIPVQFLPRVWQIAADDFKAGAQFGQPVDIYEDNTLLTRFYLTDITGGQKQQGGSYTFSLVGTDFIGIFQGVRHLGGMYSNASAGAVIAEILGASKISEDADNVTYEVSGIQYTVDATLDAQRIDNWLPVTEDARTNLREVLQLVNASPQQAVDGTPHFGVMDHGNQINQDGYGIYSGDAYIEDAPVTAVQVLEYSYFQIAGTAEEVIYDASIEGVNNDLVTFDKPYYDIHGDANLALHGSGANYARISGTGMLYGKPYTKVSRTLTASTGLVGSDNVKTIDNPLCSSLYSGLILARMARYFSNVGLVRHAMVMPENYEAGQLIDYPDPMNEQQQGYPIELTKTFSGITKADQLITAGWQPADEAPYTQSELITADGTWTPPEGATRIRLILIGGGKGGWGGYKGQDGPIGIDKERISGEGGAVGEGGDGGKVFQIDLTGDDIAASYTVTLGNAGAGGTINHGEGTDGGDTTITDGVNTYTSADGIRYPFGVLNVLTGDRYAAKGQDGIYPGNTGWGLANNPQRRSITDTQTSQTGTTTTWLDGNTSQYYNGGGGAAYGANGGDWYYIPNAYRAGDGADAALDGFNGYDSTQTVPGTGGVGGNGGGGGGCGGYNDIPDTYGSPGIGGNGSPGGLAAPGAVLALIAFGEIPPTPDDHNLLDKNGESLFDFYFEKLKEA